MRDLISSVPDAAAPACSRHGRCVRARRGSGQSAAKPFHSGP